jgi:trehalose 6-phosphate synthase/phosphatase
MLTHPGFVHRGKKFHACLALPKTDPELGLYRPIEMKDEFKSLVSNLNLEYLRDKVIEIKNHGINKGKAAPHFTTTLPKKLWALVTTPDDNFFFSEIPGDP